MGTYSIGVDFGTLSGRAVLVETSSGKELASSVFSYPHAVMDRELPDGTKLGVDWALQHPQDYLDVFANTIPAVLKETGVKPEEVIGVGVDFTACTILPVKADSTPLCFLEEFKGEPNAYVKLWKHHAAQDKANLLNETARQTGQDWLGRYGGKISSEWLFPKVMQIVEESPEVYAAADYILEATDWVTWFLTGVQTRNSCTAGYKAIWNKRNGYPDTAFFKALDPRLEHVVEEKLGCPITPLGSRAGFLCEKAAALTGLCPGTAVAVGNVDAHVTMPAVGIDGPNKMLAIMGTSTCHILISREERNVPGMCGCVEDGVYPGFFGYEAGQSCVGDHFQWFIENCLPAHYEQDAKAQGKNIHVYLREKAEKLRPGESGLLALDWWNGNRSVLVDIDLSGLLIGCSLQTQPEEIYRALIEATAYGTRMIIETFRESGVPVEEFYASGGISQKDPMTMQIYADVLNLPIRIAGSTQGPALGSAIFGAVAAGKEKGGYDDIFTAAQKMGKLRDEIYRPIPENAVVYDKLYAEYRTLHDYFGRGENDVMKRLKAIKKSQSGREA
ncbi:MAG: ribulokinase [Provencibacterium sp.]|jgi:L-ribulokinase|nr:ribulokinase [Provencibacterium sp.]